MSGTVGDAQFAFVALVQAFCSAQGLGKPSLRRDALGVVSCSFFANAAEVAFVYLPGSGRSHFNVLVDAGLAPPLTNVQSWRALMELDFSMVSNPYDACFCCDDEKTRLQLRMVFRLGDVDVPELASAISGGVSTVRSWQAAASQSPVRSNFGELAFRRA
jgi:hypothetical protein